MRTIKSSTPAAPGTKWVVRVYVGGKFYRWAVGDRTETETMPDGLVRGTWPNRSEVWGAVWRWRDELAAGGHRATVYRVCRLPPPKPRRSARTILSEISGILCDAGDVNVEPYPEAVRTLVRQRDEEHWLAEKWRQLVALLGDPIDEQSTAREAMRVVNANADLAQRWTLLTERLGGTLDERSTVLGVVNHVEEQIKAAVRERTEVILAEWQAPWSESKRRPFEQHFAEWLRDLRDGKVST